MKPIVSLRQSGLGYLQWQEFEFQPLAIGEPTSWTIHSGDLPAGMTFDTETGKISGAAEKPGVYNFALRAHNEDGSSAEVPFTIAIEASVADPAANCVDLILDLGTRAVSEGPRSADAAAAEVAVVPPFLSADDAKKLAALGPARFQAKHGDQVLFRLQVQRAGVAANVAFEDLALAIKQFEPEEILVTSSAFYSAGNGVFFVFVEFVGPALRSALSEWEGDYGAAFPAICELTWEAENLLSEEIGGLTLRGSSRSFRADIVRDVKE